MNLIGSCSNPTVNMRRGIPVRVAPQNICDVNPYICRMTPTDIRFPSDMNPSIGRLAWEPYPRGCKCCLKRLPVPDCPRGHSTSLQEIQDERARCRQSDPCRNMVQHECYQRSNIRRSTGHQDAMDRSSPNIQDQPQYQTDEGMDWKKKKRKSLFKRNKDKKKKSIEKQQPKEERVKLMRESKQRDDFVTACIGGLLVTPCHSAGSFEEELEEKEQANFYIQCKYGAKDCKGKKPPDVSCQCRQHQGEEVKLLRENDERASILPVVCPYIDDMDPETQCRPKTQEKRVCYCQAYPIGGYGPCNDRQTAIPTCQPEPCGPQYYHQRGGPPGCEATIPPCGPPLPLCTCDMPKGLAHLNQGVGELQRDPTVELIQKLLIQQAQQGIQLANALSSRTQYYLANTSNQQNEDMPKNNNASVQMPKYSNASTSMPKFSNASTSSPNFGTSPNWNLGPAGEANMEARISDRMNVPPPWAYTDRAAGTTGQTKNGHICIPKIAIPSMGDPEKSKFFIPMSFDPQAQLNGDCPQGPNGNEMQREVTCRLIKNKRSKDQTRRSKEEPKTRRSKEPRNHRSDLVPQEAGSEQPPYQDNSCQRIESLPRPPLQERSNRDLLATSSLNRGTSKRESPRREGSKRRHSKLGPCNRRSKEIKRLTLDQIDKKFEGYEAELVDALETVKNRFKQMSENENSESTTKTSTGDTQTLTYAGIECLLKHIDCMRKELKKVARGEVQ